MKNNELHHFGVKGMKWGVRNAIKRIGDKHRENKEVRRIVKETMRDKTNKQSINNFRKAHQTSFLLNSLLYTPIGAAAIRRAENPKKLAKKISKQIAKRLVQTKKNKSHGIKWDYDKNMGDSMNFFTYNKNKKLNIKKESQKVTNRFKKENQKVTKRLEADEMREQRQIIKELARDAGLRLQSKRNSKNKH